MGDIFHFFASDEELCEIFSEIEKEYNIKYVYEYVYIFPNRDKVIIDDGNVIISENSIKGIVAKQRRFECLIMDKSQNVVTNKSYAGYPDRIVYESLYHHNRESVVFRRKNSVYREDMISDYQLYVNLPSVFAQDLLKKMVKKIKKHCVKVENYYIGSDLYANREKYIFNGSYLRDLVTITESGKFKRWFEDKHIAEFIDGPMDEKLKFMDKVFSNDLIQDWDKEMEWKTRTDNWKMYEAVFTDLKRNKDIKLIKRLMELFNDESNSKSPYNGIDSGMLELGDTVLYMAYALKEEGMKTLIASFKYVPLKGKESGRKAIVKKLLLKKNIHKFQMGIKDIEEEDRELLIEILNEITDKRLLGARDTMLGLLTTV